MLIESLAKDKDSNDAVTTVRDVKSSHSSSILTLALLVSSFDLMAENGVNAMPAISNDPTKLQQVIPEVLKPSTQGHELDLPVIQKQNELEKSGDAIELKQVVFTGNTVFDSEELDIVVEGFLNKKIRASDVEAIRRKVTQYYIDHGYVNSGAILKSQSVADGILKLTIIEGKLTEVRQSGQERLREGYIADRLIVGSGEPLNVTELQDSYRQLLGNPLIEQLNGQLLPGAHPGEAIMDLQVKRARPYQLYAGADDYQTPSVGAYTGRMGGWVDNLLTLGERVDAQFIVNGGSLGYNTGINIPVTANDTRVSFRYSDTSSTIVEAPLDALKITNKIIGFDGGLSHPIYRTFADDLTLGLNFVVRQNKTLLSNNCVPGLAGAGIESCETSATVLRMSQHYIHRGESNSAVFWSTFNSGLDALGATTNSSGLQSGQFFAWLGQSMFTQRLLDNGTQLVVKGNIQLADTPVLNLERYSVGGAYTVRGYRENTYIRDNGFNTNVEVKYPLYGGDNNEKNNLYLVPFLDYGGAWNNPSVSSELALKPHTDYLFSSGIGFTWQYKLVSADFYWAHAFTPVKDKPKASHSIQDDGIHFRFNINAF